LTERAISLILLIAIIEFAAQERFGRLGERICTMAGPSEGLITPNHDEVLQVETFLTIWVMQLQRGHTRQQMKDSRLLMVRGYDIVNSPSEEEDWYSEVNIFDDDPENLIDGTWYDPQIWSRSIA